MCIRDRVDLAETRIRADACAFRERARIGAAELQRQRVFGGIETQQPRAIAMQHRAGREHFSVKQRAARQQAMEGPAVPVSPFHHGCNTKAVMADFAHL